MGLVRSVARRYARGGEPVEDLVQVGAIGLIKAVDRFEPARGSDCARSPCPRSRARSATTCATATQLVRSHARCASCRRAPRAGEDARRGREPTIAELAKAVGAPRSRSPRRCSAGAGGRPRARGRPPAAPTTSPTSALLLAGRHERLSEREQRILELRYDEDLSQADIAREIGLSQAQVSRLIATRSLTGCVPAVVEEVGRGVPSPRRWHREVEDRSPSSSPRTAGGCSSGCRNRCTPSSRASPSTRA